MENVSHNWMKPKRLGKITVLAVHAGGIIYCEFILLSTTVPVVKSASCNRVVVLSDRP
jgi:hypothetical protein